MAPLSSLITIALAAGSATAFAPVSNTRPATKLYENFGFDFAEDQVENTPQIILGEANYKTWLNGVDPDNFMNRQVSLGIFGFRELWFVGGCCVVLHGFGFCIFFCEGTYVWRWPF